jgi:Nodulation protein Z (NodZ)/Xyloglucan fucosyltransferase
MSSASTRYVVAKGCYGMGNRILSLLEAIVYARLTGRQLIVDWSDPVYSDDGSNVCPRFFALSGASYSTAELADASVAPRVWQGHIHETAYEMKTALTLDPANLTSALSIDVSTLDYEEDVVVIADWDFDYSALLPHLGQLPGHVQGQGKGPLLRGLLRDNLRLQPAIRDRVDAFKKSQFTRPVIGVHVRQTDDTTPINVRRGLAVSLGSYAPILDRLVADNRDALLFLASDSEDVLAAYRAQYPIVVATEKWYPSEPKAGLRWAFSCPDRPRMGEDALVDMYLLSECEWYVYSPRSSFGRVAGLLSSADDSRIIDVEHGDSYTRPRSGHARRWKTGPSKVAARIHKLLRFR